MPHRIPMRVRACWSPEKGELLMDGKYKLDQPIGQGGMGVVWRADQVALDRSVAVKFLKSDVPHDDEWLLREARLAACIRNPHVIDVLETGVTSSGQLFLVMPLLEGETLDERLLQGRVPTREGIEMMAQVLLALEGVHAAGIVHGDVKPSNIFLSLGDVTDGFVRLIDFGIAHSTDPHSPMCRWPEGSELRNLLGTPKYMAPELMESSGQVDARADVYAVGVMLYELLAGAPPFDADFPGAILLNVLDGTHIALTTLRPDIPEVAAIVERALDRDRNQRPSGAKAMRALLLDVLSENLIPVAFDEASPASGGQVIGSEENIRVANSACVSREGRAAPKAGRCDPP